MILCECPHQHFNTCTNVKIHLFNVPLQWSTTSIFISKFLEFTPLCYEQQKQFNIHRHSLSALSVLWYKLGNRRPGETQVDHRERPGISTCTARLFLPHDQIMTFDWLWTVTWLFKRETVCRGWAHIMWHVIIEALCILCLLFDVHSFWRRDTAITLAVYKFDKVND